MDDRGGWVSRMGRALIGGGTDTSMSGRSQGLGRRKGSVLGLVNDYTKKAHRV